MKQYAAALATTCLLLLTGCGTATARTPPFNATDVMFLQMMIPHHLQGIAIAGLGKNRATRVEVTMLAAAIESTQTTEVRGMADHLRDWRQPATAKADAHAAHGGAPGTSEVEIAALGKVRGARFERTFLNMMIAHQDDAIQLARMETAGGVNPQTRNLARQIDRSRSAQIKHMLVLLGAR